MAIIYEIKKRRVIPNWRDFKRTLPLGELNSTQTASPLDIDISRAVFDWQNSPTIGVAADLVNSAFISGKTGLPEVGEAIKLILDSKDIASNSLIQLANTINKVPDKFTEDNQQEELEIKLDTKANTIKEFQTYVNDEALFKLIHKTKTRTKRQLLNPIAWVELSRLYSFFGQEAQAEKAMIIAINLAPDNRYVLRSATRLFVHFEKFEKALYYLRKSSATKYDPWLTSAHIATSSIIERYSPLIKTGINLLHSKNFSPYQVTELASSLGTLELSEGSFKKSKDYFNLSLQSPNDNSLAQHEWISKEDSRFSFNPLSFSNVANPFEAFALENFERGNWQSAFDESIKWFLDMPYSKRPVLLGSYITSAFLKDMDASVAICKAGLRANPNDPSILNNLVYALVSSNRLEEAIPYISILKKLMQEDMPNGTRITLQATFGLIAFSSGDVDLGKRLYELAIKNAENIKNDYLRDLAIANYAKALITNDIPEKDIFIAKVHEIKLDSKHKDLQALKAEVIRLYDLFRFNV